MVSNFLRGCMTSAETRLSALQLNLIALASAADVAERKWPAIRALSHAGHNPNPVGPICILKAYCLHYYMVVKPGLFPASKK